MLFGEWCAARHSLDYTRLPDWFLLFDVLETTTSRFWSSTRRDALAAQSGLGHHPAAFERAIQAGRTDGKGGQLAQPLSRRASGGHRGAARVSAVVREQSQAGARRLHTGHRRALAQPPPGMEPAGRRRGLKAKRPSQRHEPAAARTDRESRPRQRLRACAAGCDEGWVALGSARHPVEVLVQGGRPVALQPNSAAASPACRVS
jgi:hypothetical protein